MHLASLRGRQSEKWVFYGWPTQETPVYRTRSRIILAWAPENTAWMLGWESLLPRPRLQASQPQAEQTGLAGSAAFAAWSGYIPGGQWLQLPEQWKPRVSLSVFSQIVLFLENGHKLFSSVSWKKRQKRKVRGQRTIQRPLLGMRTGRARTHLRAETLSPWEPCSGASRKSVLWDNRATSLLGERAPHPSRLLSWQAVRTSTGFSTPPSREQTQVLQPPRVPSGVPRKSCLCSPSIQIFCTNFVTTTHRTPLSFTNRKRQLTTSECWSEMDDHTRWVHKYDCHSSYNRSRIPSVQRAIFLVCFGVNTTILCLTHMDYSEGLWRNADAGCAMNGTWRNVPGFQRFSNHLTPHSAAWTLNPPKRGLTSPLLLSLASFPQNKHPIQQTSKWKIFSGK